MSRQIIFFLFTLACIGIVQSGAAELRTWKGKDGKSETEATFVELEFGETVVLRKADGKKVRVPLEKLSAEDRIYVKRKSNSSNSNAPGKSDGPHSAKALEQEAQRCRTADEALACYNHFLSDVKISAEERALAQEKLVEWEELATQKAVRCGKDWVTPQKAEEVRTKARALLNEGLGHLRGKREKQALAALLESSRIDPESIHADFCVATVYAILQHDFVNANKYFQRCLNRDREHVGTLNNLALTEVRLRHFPRAIKLWQEALRLAPNNSVVLYNVELLNGFSNEKRFNLPDELGTSLQKLRIDQGATPAPPVTQEIPTNGFQEQSRLRSSLSRNRNQGWRYTLIDKLDIGIVADEGGYASEDACIYCNGTGKFKCPIRDCAHGYVSVVVGEIAAINPVSGQPLVTQGSRRVPCRNCNGTGFVVCPMCRGTNLRER